GHQARALLNEQGGFDFVISDISMPGGLSGVEVARAAQEVRPGCRTILVSGYATAQLPELPESVVYLGKPFRVQELIDTLDTAGSGHRRSQARPRVGRRTPVRTGQGSAKSDGIGRLRGA